MLKWFRRKKDDKAMAMNAEQEISTIKKLSAMERAMKRLEEAKRSSIERRYHMVPVEIDRRGVA